MSKKPLNRIAKRWPRPYRSRIYLAKLDFVFVQVCDRIEWEAVEGTDGADEFKTVPDLMRIGERAVSVLADLGVPQAEWET